MSTLSWVFFFLKNYILGFASILQLFYPTGTQETISHRSYSERLVKHYISLKIHTLHLEYRWFWIFLLMQVMQQSQIKALSLKMCKINEQKYTGLNQWCRIRKSGLGEEPPSINNLGNYETWLFKLVNINFSNKMSS